MNSRSENRLFCTFVLYYVSWNILMSKCWQTLSSTRMLLKEAILPRLELLMPSPWFFPYLVQYTYLGSHKVSWRMDLAEKQLYWHKRSPFTLRSGDMNLGWTEEERQQQQCKTFVQVELKRSGLNTENSSAVIITGLFESPLILLRASIRQLQVEDMISLLLEPLHWIRKYRTIFRGQYGMGDTLQLLLMLKVALNNVASCFLMYLFIIHTKYAWNVGTVIMYHLYFMLNVFQVWSLLKSSRLCCSFHICSWVIVFFKTGWFTSVCIQHKGTANICVSELYTVLEILAYPSAYFLA